MRPRQIPFAIWWKLCVLTVFLAIGIASKYVSGGGVHHRLDASERVGSATFNASLRFRNDALSEPQLANLNWALQRLQGSDLQARYGSQPTIRTVVLGELMRAADPLYVTSRSALSTQEERSDAAKAMKAVLDNKAWF